jgi:PPOX class probable F420-dependent enzyme
MAVLDDWTRNLIDRRNFPVVATASPDATPVSSVIWAGTEGDAVVFVTGRRGPKARNIERNPRVSLSLHDHEDPYKAAEIRGRAQVLDRDPQPLLDQLSHKYTGEPYAPEDDEPLAVVRIEPEKVIPFDG